MGRQQLSFGQSVSHWLGKPAFQYRVSNSEFRAVNVATLGWQLGNLTYTFSTSSDPTSGDHSEEKLLEIFDNIQNFDEDTAAEVKGIALYTELAPCYSALRGPFTFNNPIPDSPLITRQTVKHRSCSKILRDRFPNLDIFFTVQDNTALRNYIAFQSSWSKWEEGTQNIILHAFNLLEREGKRRFFYRCASQHMTLSDIRSKLDLPSVLQMAKAACGNCHADTVICGTGPLT